MIDRVLAPVYYAYEKMLERQVRSSPLPTHVGLILDGNRRFAKAKGEDPKIGHYYGLLTARKLITWAMELQVPALTLFVMSADNFNRSPEEVGNLVKLLVSETTRMKEDPRLVEHKVRVRAIGRRDLYPAELAASLTALETATAHHGGMVIQIAVGYGGREEIVDAVKRSAQAKATQGVSLEQFATTFVAKDIDDHLYTAGVPDPDFIIRTSGEERISGFLLWQAAYSELYFTDVFWPAFRRLELLRALRNFQGRQRRFGK